MYPMNSLRQEKRGLTAQAFLIVIERNLDSLMRFLGSERTYVITDITPASRSSNLLHGNPPNLDDRLLCMLESQEKTLQYYKDFPGVDFTNYRDKWSMLQSFRTNSEGKLPDFAKKYDLDLDSIRNKVTFAQKEFVVEHELSEPGLSIIFLPVRPRLKEINLVQLELLCKLLLQSPCMQHFW
jgi:hypothetical protein